MKKLIYLIILSTLLLSGCAVGKYGVVKVNPTQNETPAPKPTEVKPTDVVKQVKTDFSIPISDLEKQLDCYNKMIPLINTLIEAFERYIGF